MPQPAQPSDSTPLNGWKDIAAYLGRSVRAVQRWEHELGLPVHRIRTADGQTVYAFRQEIDRWREGVDLRRPAEDENHHAKHAADHLPNSAAAPDLDAAPAAVTNQEFAPVPWWRRKRAYVALGVMVLAGFALSLVSLIPTTDRPTPTQFILSGRHLDARDSTGRAAWRHDFGVDVSPIGAHPSGWLISDLDNDGASELVIAVRFAPLGQPASSASRSDVLMAFTRDSGEVLWTVTAPDRLPCRTETYSSPWRVYALAVSDQAGPKKVWVAFNHHTWWPGLVFEVAPTGQSELKYAQTGWIRSLALWRTASGSYLAAGGTDNQQARPVLALIDLAGAPVTMPAVSDRFQCSDLPAAAPVALFEFENPETMRAKGIAYSEVQNLNVTGADLKAGITASGGSMIVHIGPDFSVADVSFSDQYWTNHEDLERDGAIRHKGGVCPSRQPQLIRRWMPGVGWQDLKIMPTIRSIVDPPQR